MKWIENEMIPCAQCGEKIRASKNGQRRFCASCCEIRARAREREYRRTHKKKNKNPAMKNVRDYDFSGNMENAMYL
jgi:hypothetical protein